MDYIGIAYMPIGNGTNTLDIPSNHSPGTYEYYCVLTAEGCDEVESEKTTLTVNKATYTGIQSDTVYVKANQMTQNNVYTLPDLPSSDMTYEIQNTGDNLIAGVSNLKRDASTDWKWVLTFNTDSKPAGTEENIILKINGGILYEDSTFTLTVKAVSKISVTITGVTETDNEYSGQPQKGYTGVPQTGAYTGELNHQYQGRHGTTYDSETAPTDAGDYTVTLSVPEDADYSGSSDVDFAIRKKEVKVKPTNYIMVQGQPLPSAGEIWINYTGFIAGDNANNSISEWAVVKLDISDSNTPGESDITFETEATLLPGKEKNYTLKHEKSTLTISPSGSQNTYPINVTDGTATPTVSAAGTTVTITSAPTPSGQQFKEWNITPAVTFVDGTSKTNATVKFIMPEHEVTATATYEALPTNTYYITVRNNGNGTARANVNSAVQGTEITLTATPNSGYSFKAWEVISGDVVFANSGSATTTFTMPANNVTVTANWSYNGGGGGGNSGSSGSGSTTTTTTTGKTPDQPVTAAVSVTATAGANNAASASIPEKSITGAIAKAQSDAKALGKTENGIAVALHVTMPKGATSLTATLTRNSLNSLVIAGVISLELNGSPVAVSFDKKALAEIQKQSSGNISITIVPNVSLSASAKAMIGTRPVYDLMVSYTKDGKNIIVSSFSGGTATVSIPYTLGKNEAVGGLYAVYVDAKGNATRIADSAYDVNSKCIIFTTTHFSLYGVGYTAPSAKFTDIANHWGKESIDYVVGRGLLSGTSETAFAPNTAMTHEMLVTALGRLAGVDVKTYTTNNFTDVNADSTFQPYIEWAYKKGIVQGTENGKFEPDRAITREEIAVIFANFARETGYTLPATREATTYADASSIGSTYKTAVTVMQRSGIMMGGTDNKFNPKASVTRAEVSSMLYRYIKLTIDTATAQG